MAGFSQVSENANEARSKADDADGSELPHLVVDRGPGAGGSGALQVRRSQVPARGAVRRYWFLPLFLLLVPIGGLAGLYFQPPGLQFAMRTLGLEPGAGSVSPIAVPVQTPPIDVGADEAKLTVVVGLGRLEPEGEVITVAPPFGAGDARIASLAVNEGDRVDQGALLATLDSEPQLQAAVAAAEANVAVREAALAQTRDAVRASRDEAEATLARMQAVAETAERALQRAVTLHERRVISQAEFDDRERASREANREVERARATVSRYRGQELDTQVDVVLAERNLDAARSDLARAKTELDKAYVRAPVTGRVLSVAARPGEKPGSDGILNLGNTDRMTVKVEIYQTEIGKIVEGDAVEIRAAALPHPLSGQVQRIGLEVGQQTLIDDDPAANTEARVIEITVMLDDTSSETAARFTNLQVEARIAVGGEV
jgi:HlyD family secretion protein